MLTQIFDSILETLAVFRKAALVYIANAETFKQAALLYISGEQAVAAKIFLINEKGEQIMAELAVIPDNKKATLQVAFTSIKGNPAPIEGAPQWASSNETIATVTPDEVDPSKAVVVAVGPLGIAQISVQGDADLGEGVKPVVALQEIQVVASEAAIGTVVVGPLEDQ